MIERESFWMSDSSAHRQSRQQIIKIAIKFPRIVVGVQKLFLWACASERARWKRENCASRENSTVRFSVGMIETKNPGKIILELEILCLHASQSELREIVKTLTSIISFYCSLYIYYCGSVSLKWWMNIWKNKNWEVGGDMWKVVFNVRVSIGKSFWGTFQGSLSISIIKNAEEKRSEMLKEFFSRVLSLLLKFFKCSFVQFF